MKNLERIRDIMAHHSFDGLAIVPGTNMEYLTGSKFHLSERPVVLFIEKVNSTFILPELESPKISNLGFDFITYNDQEGYESAFSKFNHKIEKLGDESRLIRHIELDIIAVKDISTNIHDAHAEVIEITSKLYTDVMADYNSKVGEWLDSRK